MSTLTIALPWPERALWPNSRAHWHVLAQARKEAKRTGFFTVLAELPEPPALPDKLPVTVRFMPSTRRRFDSDNALAALKGQLDGIAQALGVDDTRFEPITVCRGPVSKPGCVVVEITL